VRFSSTSARHTQWLYDEMQCSSDMTCVAAGGSDALEYDGVALVSERGGTRWGEAKLPPGTGAITAIGCTPAGLCVATAPILGHQAAVLTFHASGWSISPEDATLITFSPGGDRGGYEVPQKK
jgi:hypothetical protein